MTRREAREQAFELIFERSFNNIPFDETLELAELARNMLPDEFSVRLARKTVEELPQIDAEIEKYLKNWKSSRISRVALAILRLSVCEIRFLEDVPTSVSINEAVELAKKYGGEDDASFVNGILGSVAKSTTVEG